MYICLCLGVTSGAVQQAIQDGANSTKKVAACRHTVRVMLDAAAPESDKRPVERIRRRWRAF